jgi:4-hydroxybenzoate polyprenyltransferase
MRGEARRHQHHLAVHALLQCGSCRFTAFYFLPFYAGLLHQGGKSPAWAVFGAGYWFLHSLGTELANRIADRQEDEINRPDRTALCHRVGFPTLAKVTVACWIIVASLDVALLIISPSILLAVLLFAAGAFGIGYSFGPHLKRHPVAALLILTFPFSGTFLVGWAARQPPDGLEIHDFCYSALPFAILLGSLAASIGGAKDLTDKIGDAVVGYKSAWVRAVRSHSRLLVMVAIASPFVYIVVAVATGLLSPRMLVMSVFAPLSWYFAAAASRATTNAQLDAVREIGYTYCGTFMAVAVSLYQPSAQMLIAVIGTASYWILASQWLHWTDGFRMEKLRLVASAGRGGPLAK